MCVDFLRHAQSVPLLSTGRVINVAAVDALRRQVGPRVTRMAMFIKAYALAAQAHPDLRTSYIKYPWPRLYTHPFTTASIPIEREWEGEMVVLAAKIRSPETMPLPTIAEHLNHYKTAPVLSISAFRQILRLGRMPAPLRRFVFWSTLHFSGEKLAKRFGTCLVSSLGGLGAEQYLPRTALTSYFTFGPISVTGDVEIKIIYDHRVTDDSPVARALISVEAALNGAIHAELSTLPRATHHAA
jgi:hypothetical protein